MLTINNLSAQSQSQDLIKNINLEIREGETHVIMGPKNSGKSALAHSIFGHPSIEITDGDIIWNSQRINDIPTDQKAGLGIFIGFQLPPQIEKITNFDLIKEIYADRYPSTTDIEIRYRTYCEILNLSPDQDSIYSTYNDAALSQLKRNELIHMLMSDVKLAIIDEVDQDLTEKDIILAGSVLKNFVNQENRMCLVITNNDTLLKILTPTHVHVMVDGEIKMSGSAELCERIVKDGYSELS
jgi:Fe-S cluster assembly ATP-binding protein